MRRPGWVLAAYLALCGAGIAGIWPQLGREIFPRAEASAFRLRLRAPDGTHIGRTEQIAQQALQIVSRTVGAEKIALSLGYVGMVHSNFPINAVYQWSRGPEEAILYIALRDQARVDVEQLKDQLRARLARDLPEVRVSFEPADIINEVMSFGAPTPLEIAISGPDYAASRAYAEKVYAELARLESLRDLQFGQSLDYPTLAVQIDREKAGLAGLTPQDVSRSLVMATSSSRFVVPNYWADPKTGIAYQVQVELPRPVVRTVEGIGAIRSVDDLGQIPLKETHAGAVLLRDIAQIQPGTMSGQYDRYNMKRQVTLTANRAGVDLGQLMRQVDAALQRAGPPPQGTQIEVRGQILPLREMASSLTAGLAIALLSVLLLLTAYFQSVRLAIAAVSSVPAVLAGVAAMLWLTGSTLNIQSFTGAIMSVGVAMANAILLVTFAQRHRRQGLAAEEAARHAAAGRLRAILMTSSAMIGGMLPMALALGEVGQQNAPLGRAVIGGLGGGTLATLLVLPTAIAWLFRGRPAQSVSLDPDDPDSPYFAPSSEPQQDDDV